MSQFAKDGWYAPGSDEAIAHGCRCAVIDNCHGRGYMGMPGIYVQSGDCPLHGTSHKDLAERDARNGVPEVDK